MPTPFTLASPVLPLAAAAIAGAMLMADTAPARAQGEAIGGALIGGTADAVIGAPRERRACHFRGNGEVAQVSRGNCT